MASSKNRTAKEALRALQTWAESEEYKDSKSKEMLRYAVCAGLAICEHAKTSFPLSEEDFLTPKNQVRKIGGASIKRIVARFGVTKDYAKEGGRTTRSTVPAAKALAERINRITTIKSLNDSERDNVFTELQEWLVENKVKPFFEKQRLEIEFTISDSATQFISRILAAATDRNQGGAVAQHLVGAKLALRFPDMEIKNYSYTTADIQLGRKGDFEIHDTVFHVTVAPAPALMEKMKSNLANNYRVVLITSSNKYDASCQLAEIAGILERIDIYSIEQFVAQNIDEIALFNRNQFVTTFALLLNKYNGRVAEIEADRSLLISVPGALLK